MEIEELSDIVSSNKVEEYATIDKNIVSQEITNPINAKLNHFHIVAVSPSYFSLQPITIVSGHFPQSSNEIIIPKQMSIDYNGLYNIGDTVEMDKAYKIVGFSTYGRQIAASYDKGYVIFTKDDDRLDNKVVYLRLKNIKEDGNFVAYGNNSGRQNDDLLGAMGINRGESAGRMIQIAIATLIVIVVSMAVALIGNSFLMSMSDRTATYGLLSSLGASRNKLVILVVLEALFVAIIAIPIGLGCGVGVAYLSLNTVAKMIALAANIHIEFSLYINWVSIVAILGLSVLAVLLSSLIPIVKFRRSSDISKIRQNGDIALGKMARRQVNYASKKCRTVDIKWELAFKNIARFKKKYAFIIFSAVFCMVIYVSAMSYTSYARAAMLATSGQHSGVSGENYAENMLALIDIFSTIFVALVALIAIVNVFNTNFASVVIRTKELAIMRAIGAENRDVALMLLYESLIVSGIAVVFGVAISAVASLLLCVTFGGEGVNYNLPLAPILTSIVGVALTLVISALTAARKAVANNIADAER